MTSHPRLQKQTTFNSADVPIPTTKQSIKPPSAGTIRRAKTLTRPERGVAPAPLIKPPAPLLPSPSGTLPTTTAKPPEPGWDAWRIFSKIVSFWAPGVLLSSLGGLRDKQKQQAWREKIALCVIALVMGGVVGFATVGMQRVLCPNDSTDDTSRFSRVGSVTGSLSVQGVLYKVSPNAQSPPGVDLFQLAKTPGQDITTLFTRDANQFNACRGLPYRVAQDAPCSSAASCPLPALNSSSTFASLGLLNLSLTVGYDWSDVAHLQNYFVIDGAVLNMNPYINLHSNPITADNVDLAIRTLFKSNGKDGTRLFYNRADLKSAVPCLKQRYYAGNIDKITPGCMASQLLLYAGLIIVLGLVLARFAMACVFNWFLSARLAGTPDKHSLNRSVISPAVLPEGANVAIDNRTGTAPWANNRLKKGTKTPPRSLKPTNSSSTLVNGGADPTTAPTITLAQIGAELFAVCLVTCYSEGEESLRTTLDSISRTTYSDQRKLLFVVADGMITGAGEKRSTPDICVSLLDADPRFGNPMPMSYNAVGSGAKQENRAMVYAGHYSTCHSSSVLCGALIAYNSRCWASNTDCHHREMWN